MFSFQVKQEACKGKRSSMKHLGISKSSASALPSDYLVGTYFNALDVPIILIGILAYPYRTHPKTHLKDTPFTWERSEASAPSKPGAFARPAVMLCIGKVWKLGPASGIMVFGVPANEQSPDAKKGLGFRVQGLGWGLRHPKVPKQWLFYPLFWGCRLFLWVYGHTSGTCAVSLAFRSV